MKNTIAMIGVTVACVACADNGVTNTFTATATNTPISAYDYSVAGNWSDPSLGVPLGTDACATFTAENIPYFVKVPSEFTTTLLTLSDGTFILGDYMKVNSTAGSATAANGSTNYPYGGIIFGELKVTKKTSTGGSSNFGGIQLAGHFRPGAWDGGSDANQIYAHSGGPFTLRHDLFADSSDPQREGAYHYSKRFIESAGFEVYGPKGAAANDSSWNVTAGEVYLEYAGQGDHAVVPGQVVTGAGVPSGAFVRYVFPGTKWIAISSPATISASAASLHFAAITPSVVEYWPEYWMNDGRRTWRLMKFREEDGLKMVVGKVLCSNAGITSWTRTTIGLSNEQVESGFLPGDMVISNFEFSATVTFRPIYLQNCRIVIVNPYTWDATQDQYCGPNGIRFELNDAAFTAELKVPEGKSVDMKSFCNLKGTLVKKGSGTLVVPMFNTDVSGSINVVEGTLDLRRGSPVVGQPLTLGSLAISAGATFVVPEGGLTVESLDAAPGSMISGGKLTVINRPVSAIPRVTGGAELSFKFGLSAAEVFPASSLRLHFDASVPSSITTNAAGGVTRWDDLSGSGDYLTPNTRTIGECPTNRCNVANGLPMVDLGPFCWTNAGPKTATEKDRSLYLRKGDGTLYQSTDVKLGDPSGYARCYTAICVIDSRYGGGPLVGAHGSISSYPNYSPFPCGIRDTADWLNQQDARYYIHTDMKSGGAWWGAGGSGYADGNLIENGGNLIFRVNGASTNPSANKFTGGFEIVSYAIEHDRFGCFGLGCWGNNTANGLMFGEVVVFSNKLSLAEIKLAEEYLTHKWTGYEDSANYDRIVADAISVGAGSTLSGVNGGTYVTESLSGSGTVAADVALGDGGVISVESDANGEIAGITIDGTLVFDGLFGIAVSGSAKPAEGIYRICSANEIKGASALSNVTVTPFPGDARPYAVTIDEEGISLKIQKSGCCIVFR